MRNPSSLFAILVALAVLPPGLAAAQKLDKDDKKWLDDVRPIMLADEEKTYKGLKDKSDRTEFQLIFWARRDPDLATPENEFQAEYLEGPRGPPTRSTGSPGASAPPPTAAAPSSCSASRTRCRMTRRPCRVTSPRRPGPTATGRARPSAGGKAVIAFDAECRAPAGFSDQLDRIAAAKVLQPEHRLPDEGRAPREARRAAPEGHRGPGPLQAAAAGLRDRAPGLVPQGRRRRHGAPRTRARRRQRPPDDAGRRREDGEHLGGGQRGGRGREGSRPGPSRRRTSRSVPTAPSWPPSSWA